MQHFNYLKPWPNGLARVQSQHKFAKPELAYGLDAMRWVAKRIASRLASSRKFTHAFISRIYSWLAINFCRLGLGEKLASTWELRANFSSTKVVVSYCKSAQANASGWPNETHAERKLDASQKLVLTPVELRVRLARD